MTSFTGSTWSLQLPLLVNQVVQKHLMKPFLFRDASTYGTAKSLVDKGIANIILTSFTGGFNSLCDC